MFDFTQEYDWEGSRNVFGDIDTIEFRIAGYEIGAEFLFPIFYGTPEFNRLVEIGKENRGLAKGGRYLDWLTELLSQKEISYGSALATWYESLPPVEATLTTKGGKSIELSVLPRYIETPTAQHPYFKGIRSRVPNVLFGHNQEQQLAFVIRHTHPIIDSDIKELKISYSRKLDLEWIEGIKSGNFTLPTEKTGYLWVPEPILLYTLGHLEDTACIDNLVPRLLPISFNEQKHTLVYLRPLLPNFVATPNTSLALGRHLGFMHSLGLVQLDRWPGHYLTSETEEGVRIVNGDPEFICAAGRYQGALQTDRIDFNQAFADRHDIDPKMIKQGREEAMAEFCGLQSKLYEALPRSWVDVSRYFSAPKS
jgi:hypothetical protein